MVNDQELKAGHGPASKVGGARRTRNRSRSEQVGGMAGAEEPTAEETAPVTGEDGEVVATGEESTEVQAAETEVVGPYKENSPAAVKSFHDKPLPSKNIQVTKNPQATANNMNIQQPRK